MRHPTRKWLFPVIALVASTLACNYVYSNPADRAATRVAVADASAAEERVDSIPENVDNVSEGDPPAVSGSRCAALEVFEFNVRNDEDLSPDVFVYANAEETAPPAGFSVDVPPLPNSARMSATARVMVQEGAQITASTSQTVDCAGVLLIGDLITPTSIYLDGELVWSGYLYPLVNQSPRPYRTFFVRFPVEPARPVSVSIRAAATGDSAVSIWAPVEGFGFYYP